jgi:hypothetical protein
MAAGQETQVGHGAGALAPARQARGARPLRARRRADWTLAVPPAVTLIVMLWGMATPSYWRDESATLAATDRSIPQLLRLLGRVDAVHGLYYLILWPVVHFVGTREFETRLPSAIAMAAAALGIAAIGRRLRSRRAGLYAGLVFAAMPLVTLQGHDARPCALETAAAVLATYLLLRAAEKPAAPRFAPYGLSMVLLGYMHPFGLLIIPAHALALIPAARLARARRGAGADGAGEADPCRAGDVDVAGLMVRWLASGAFAGVLLAPLLWLGWREQGPSHGCRRRPVTTCRRSRRPSRPARWPRPRFSPRSSRRGPSAPTGRTGRCGPAGGAGRSGPCAPRRRWRRGQAAGSGPSPGSPSRGCCSRRPCCSSRPSSSRCTSSCTWSTACLPAAALLAGAGLAALGRPLRLAALGLVVALGLPAQFHLRTPLAGGYIRSTAQFLAQHERPATPCTTPASGAACRPGTSPTRTVSRGCASSSRTKPPRRPAAWSARHCRCRSSNSG